MMRFIEGGYLSGCFNFYLIVAFIMRPLEGEHVPIFTSGYDLSCVGSIYQWKICAPVLSVDVIGCCDTLQF